MLPHAPLLEKAVRSLRCVDCEQPDSSPWLPELVGQSVQADSALFCEVGSAAGRRKTHRISTFGGLARGATRVLLDRHLDPSVPRRGPARHTGKWVYVPPLGPGTAQGSLGAIEGLCRELGVADSHQARLCIESDTHVAWLWVFQKREFTNVQRQVLRQLCRPLVKRLDVEWELVRAREMRSWIETLLGQLAVPAWIASASGRLICSNREAQPAHGEAVAIPIGSGGDMLFVQKQLPWAEARMGAQAERWRLTKRERQVLRYLLDGAANKQIAAAIGISLRAVELHVSSILGKSGSESRSEVVARFWGHLAELGGLNPCW